MRNSYPIRCLDPRGKGRRKAMQRVSTVETAAGVAVGRWNDVADLAGRIALAAIFIMSGADKLFAHTAQTVQMMEAYRVPLAALLVYPPGTPALPAAPPPPVA